MRHRFGRSLGAWVAAVMLAIAAVTYSAAVRAKPASPSPLAGAITYIGVDSNVYYCSGTCAEPQCLTCPVAGEQVRRELRRGIAAVRFETIQSQPAAETVYEWPTFSPDGARIAYSSVARDKGGMHYALFIYDLKHRQATKIFSSRTERIVYIYWLPDGAQLSFLLSEPHGLSLMIAQLKAGAPIRIVMTGMPLFYAFSPTPGRLAVHTAGSDPETSERVVLMSLTATSQNVDIVLSHGRTTFKAPCWSRDGKHLAWIENNNAESNLIVANADATHPRSLASLPIGDTSIEWSPDGEHIAYATTVIPHEPEFHEIKLVDIRDASTRTLTHDPAAAFYFSPDARYLAYIEVPKKKPFYTWKVVNLKTGATRSLDNFVTTREESIAYNFFDQLALSHSVWSPDSRALIYAGVRLFAVPSHSLNMAPPPSVWVMPIDGSTPRRIGRGTIAFYSPAAGQ